MFDALEKRFLKDKDRQQEMQGGDLINELYQGSCEDYVECKGVSSTHPPTCASLCYYLLLSVVLLVLERIHF